MFTEHCDFIRAEAIRDRSCSGVWVFDVRFPCVEAAEAPCVLLPHLLVVTTQRSVHLFSACCSANTDVHAVVAKPTALSFR